MSRLARFWRAFGHRYRALYALGTLCLIATNYLTVSIPGFVQEAVDALADGRGPDAAIPWAWAILGAGVGVMVVRTLSRTLIFNPGRTIEFRFKNTLFHHLLELPRRFYARMRPGEIISRGTNDVGAVRSIVGFCTLQIFNALFAIVLTLGRMFWIDVGLTLLCVIPLIVSALVLRIAVRAMFRLTLKIQKDLAGLSDQILETYNAVGVLQSFNALSGAQARFDKENQALLDTGLELIRVRSWLLPVVSVTGNICVVILLFFGGRSVVDGGMTVGELAAFAVYINILVGALIGMGWMIGAFQRGWVSLQRVYEVLDAPIERAIAGGALPPAGPQGYGLTVDGLTFAYADADADAGEVALRDASLRLAPGERLGIFGLTGAGKSTLLDVLARVHDPPAGAIRLDGIDVLDIPVRDYWRAVGYVTQEPFLFSRTVRANIALAEPMPDETIDAAVRAAADDAALAPDLEAFPAGLDTRVGERGITVSGGQRQRIALARAFYRDFELLLLDDVMSAVDHATEKKLIDAIYRRSAGRSAIIVSHRISVLARADRVLVLDEGRVVAEGRHEDLLADRSGPYARAWRLQQAAEALDGAANEVEARPT